MTNITKGIIGTGSVGLLALFLAGAGDQNTFVDNNVNLPLADSTSEILTLPKTEEPTFQDNLVPKEETKAQRNQQNCHPSYSGCLNPNASDYDCAGGSGNGPYYTGRVQVVGPDEFDLDRDNDGWGCE